MAEVWGSLPLLVMLVGGTVIACILTKTALERIGIAPLIGWFALGFALRVADGHWGILGPEGHEVFDFLARIGIFCLLFRIGLESNLAALIDKLRSAIPVFFGDCTVSGLIGFATAYYVVGLGLIPSLFAGAALVPTSVGIPLNIWQQANVLDTDDGRLLLDVAELDDIGGVVVMALILALVPVIREGGENGVLMSRLGTTMAIFALKAVIFGAFCLFFSRFLEERMTRWFSRIEAPPDPMLLVAGVGLVIAAMADLIGFSIAIGAFFAGLLFSRDPVAVKMEASFESIHDFFSPFFFLGVGLYLDPDSFGGAAVAGGFLVAAAIIGKALGAGLPTLLLSGSASALLVGVSMFPRAEICLIVIQRGRELGDWAVSPELHSAVVIVSAVTCLLSPLALRPLLARHPPTERKSEGG